jgi:hypothetical protein
MKIYNLYHQPRRHHQPATGLAGVEEWSGGESLWCRSENKKFFSFINGVKNSVTFYKKIRKNIL